MVKQRLRKLLISIAFAAVVAYIPALAPVAKVAKPLLLKASTVEQTDEVQPALVVYNDGKVDPKDARRYDDGQELPVGCWPNWDGGGRVFPLFRPWTGGPIRRLTIAFWGRVWGLW